MNAKSQSQLRRLVIPAKQLSGSDGGFVFDPLFTGSIYRNRWRAELQQNAVERDRRGGRPGSGGCAAALFPGGTVVAYVEAEGIDASGPGGLSDIERRRDRAMGHLL